MMTHEMYDMYHDLDSNTFEFELQKAIVEPGRTFSAEGMEHLSNSMTLFMGARIMRAWHDRNEPPTVVKVTVTVEAR